MLKKINSIQNLGIFKDFNWDRSVKEPGGQTSTFQRINIIYGRNYSGKTTISRIFRAIETGKISDNYDNPRFELEDDNGRKITLNSPNPPLTRVFNEDFTRENLKFINNPDESITSFAILGEDNNKLQEEIQRLEFGLGSIEGESGSLYKRALSENAYNSAKSRTQNARKSLERKLTDKANSPKIGIKHNKTYGNANYNVTKLQSDIEKILAPTFTPCATEELEELEAILKEERKALIPSLNLPSPNAISIFETLNTCITENITISNPIRELLDNSLLETWVREGRGIHEGKRDSCGFCGSPLPSNLWARLDEHFSKESEGLRKKLEQCIDIIDLEIDAFKSIKKINSSEFYSSFHKELNSLEQALQDSANKYAGDLVKLKQKALLRLSNIATPLNKIENPPAVNKITESIENLNKLRIKSNSFTSELDTTQQQAKDALRLADVHNFVLEIELVKENEEINKLATIEAKAEKTLDGINKEIEEINNSIGSLKAKLKDETKGAAQVNKYLTDFFGHKNLSIKSVEIDSGYKFEVTRDGVKAHNLSEGECSLIAFCYFIAKLSDINTKDQSPIIYIDDPISSLDSNHIFFIFSIINSEIIINENHSQVFISTHNLDFLKYLKRLSPKSAKGKNLERKYFIIERSNSGSEIKVMPTYLKEYVTEFNYLFHQLFKCANATNSDAEADHECYYNYGNNARKFLEVFLYFKYPDAKNDDSSKLLRFFGENTQATVLTERINNEFSHLAGVFERSINPVDIPEMRSSAQFILNTIRTRDVDQYNALLASIGNPTQNF
ncbi:AAA family ATPase [Pseudomonas knackmussii]|uniref:AAA family ATPase n=1 Tax=Pseudomonas knackmussii TaxID=65741 RepID=UPI003BBC8934